MADDYLSDREQEEALRDWWRENWRWIIGGVAMGVALLVGWRSWQSYSEAQAHDASQDYAQFQSALAQRDMDQAGRLLQDLVADHGSAAYVQQGRLMLAKAAVDAGEFDEAIVLLREVVDGSKDDELASVARLRVARLLIQQGEHDEALGILDAAKAGAFAALAREIRGDALMAKGDLEAARAEYAAALSGDDAGGAMDRSLLRLKLREAGGEAGSAQGQP